MSLVSAIPRSILRLLQRLETYQKKRTGSFLKVFGFNPQGTIHEVTRSITKHGPFRAVSCDFVDRASCPDERIGTPIEPDRDLLAAKYGLTQVAQAESSLPGPAAIIKRVC